MKTPLPKGEKRAPMLDIQITVQRPIDRNDSFGTHVFFDEARTPAELDAAIERAFGRLRNAVMETVR